MPGKRGNCKCCELCEVNVNLNEQNEVYKVREDGSKASVQKITFSGGGPLLCLHQKCCYICLCWCFKMFKMFFLIGLQPRFVGILGTSLLFL